MIELSYDQPQRATDGVLIHATGFDFRDSSGALYTDAEPAPFNATFGPHVESALDMRREIIGLKLGRDSAVRAVDLGVIDGDAALRPDRARALALMGEFADALSLRSIEHSYHGLADVPDLMAHGGDLDSVYSGKFRGAKIVVRAAEGLAPQAATVANDVRSMVTSGEVPGTVIEGGEEEGGFTLYRHIGFTKEDGESVEKRARTMLYGYTFNSGPGRPEERRVFPYYPTCETHIAVTVLEQVMRAANVVRFIPRTFKQNDYSARYLLNMLGVTDLPVVSVSVGDNGGVNKIIPWSKSAPIDADVHQILRTMRSQNH